MVFAVIRSPLKVDNFLFYFYIFNINFLYFLAKNIYFAPKCTGQPDCTIYVALKTKALISCAVIYRGEYLHFDKTCTYMMINKYMTTLVRNCTQSQKQTDMNTLRITKH